MSVSALGSFFKSSAGATGTYVAAGICIFGLITLGAEVLIEFITNVVGELIACATVVAPFTTVVAIVGGAEVDPEVAPFITVVATVVGEVTAFTTIDPIVGGAEEGLAVTEIPKTFTVTVDGEDRTKDTKTTISKFPDVPSMLVHVPPAMHKGKYSITISLGSNPQLSVIDHKQRIEKLVLDYQTDFDIKDRVWSIVDDKNSAINVKIGKLMSLSTEEIFTEPIAELLLSDVRGMHL